MQKAKRHFNRLGKAVVAVMLAGLILLLDAMAACPALHELIHHGAAEYNHQCAVKMFAHGKVEPAAGGIPVVLPAARIEIIALIEFSVFSAAIKNLPQGRAPPAVPSFQT